MSGLLWVKATFYKLDEVVSCTGLVLGLSLINWFVACFLYFILFWVGEEMCSGLWITS